MKSLLMILAASSLLSAGNVQEGFIPVPGGKVWYKVVGAEKKGIPLLVLHGGPGAPHDYLEPLAALGDERPVIFYDQLGCGNSERPTDPSLWKVERFVDELSQVRQFLKLKQVHLLGQSWGTMLAVEYLLKKPAGVKSLVLSAPYLSTRRWVEDQRRYVKELPPETRAVIERCEAQKTFADPAYQEAMMVFYRKHVCRLDAWPDCLNRTMDKLGQSVYEDMWGPSEFTMNGSLKEADLTPRLKEIKLPTLLTCGRFDEATPETTSYYQRQLPNSRMIVFDDASHEHHLEKCEEYLHAVRTFLRQVEGK